MLAWSHWCFFSPALTVMASMNWSLQLLVPTRRARLVFLISLSTVFYGLDDNHMEERSEG